MDAATISAVISSLTLISMVILYVLSQKIHKLVNSRLTEALDQIETLQKAVEMLGGPRAPPKRDHGEADAT